MAIALPKTLKEFNLFLDGDSWAGIAEEVTLPKIAAATEEHRAAGMDMPIEIELGLEKMEASFTLRQYTAKAYKMLFVPDALLKFKGSLENGSGVEPVEIIMRGMLKEIDPGTVKNKELSDFKGTISLTYYKLSMDNEDLVEIDVLNMIRKIDGNDQLSDRRKALGV